VILKAEKKLTLQAAMKWEPPSFGIALAFKDAARVAPPRHVFRPGAAPAAIRGRPSAQQNQEEFMSQILSGLTTNTADLSSMPVRRRASPLCL